LGVEDSYDDGIICQPVPQFGNQQPALSIANQPIGARVFPNPATQSFTLELLTPLASNAELVLADAFGKEVAVHLLKAKLQNFEFPVDDIAEGIYFLSIREGNQKLYNTKLVVLK
jgi:Secretion system C-terminal sorting domain